MCTLEDETGNFGADTRLRETILDRNDSVGFLDALHNGSSVERLNTSQIYNLGLNAFLGEFLCSLQ